MNKHIPVLLLIFAACILLRAELTFAAPGGARSYSKKFEALIIKAQAGDGAAAEELAKISLRADVAKIDDATLQELASLLDSPSGAVRMWTAAAIGQFGIRGAIYTPRLQQIVSEEACNMTGVSAADTANLALQKLGVTPEPFGCIHK